jgi:nucleotide-binding universal stress UspA family protein
MSEPLGAPEALSVGPVVAAVPTIVVGYSPTPEGRAALHRALVEAKLRSSTLIVVVTSAAPDLEDLQSKLGASGVPFEVRGGAEHLDPAEDLIAAAEESGADFIVIGLRRRSAVGKLLLGSNAQRVLLDASCPVLAVKAEPS